MKNRIFKNSPFFDEAVQMPVDKDVFAFRMRQRNDFACSCGGTKIIHDANSENLNLFAGPQHPPRGQLPFDANVFLIARAERLLSNELAE
jgi:hypothetical protein